MTINEYQKSAMRTNDGFCNDRLLREARRFAELSMIYGHKDAVTIIGYDPGELINGALGLPGESGEVADLIKKGIFHDHNINIGDLVKELGDVCWYLALICHSINIPLEEIMSENIEKLKRRYPEGFSSEASINREE